MPRQPRVATAACQRCRFRKSKCDRNLPRCRPCERAGADCLIVDPATGREVPRTYLNHLEGRVKELEDELGGSNIEGDLGPVQTELSAPAFLGASAGLKFSQILSAALQGQQTEQRNRIREQHWLKTTPARREGSGSKPRERAQLPLKETALEYLGAYFDITNAQLPILHQHEFFATHFKRIYGRPNDASEFSPANLRSPSSSIGSPSSAAPTMPSVDSEESEPYYRRQGTEPSHSERVSLYLLFQVFAISVTSRQQHFSPKLPEALHLAAMVHYRHLTRGVANRLELLQCILLLAQYSMMRPAAPGVWYVIGWATRLCTELGLHDEERFGHLNDGRVSSVEEALLARDHKRRLFWCLYSLDRQISIYLGRPHSLPDHCVRTPLPSMLPDHELSLSTIGNDPSNGALHGLDVLRESAWPTPEELVAISRGPSSKHVALAFISMRRMQSEIQRIVYEHAPIPREFGDFEEWRWHMLGQLELWKTRLPSDPAVLSSTLNTNYVMLNFYQARLLLFGVSPADPSPNLKSMRIIAHAGLQIIKIYADIANMKALNYSWAAVHNLFLAGTSYLFVLYHDQSLRSKCSLNELETVMISALAVMEELTKYCDAALTCKESLQLLSQAVVELVRRERHGFQIQGQNQHRQRAQQPQSQHHQQPAMAHGRQPSDTRSQQSSPGSIVTSGLTPTSDFDVKQEYDPSNVDASIQGFLSLAGDNSQSLQLNEREHNSRYSFGSSNKTVSPQQMARQARPQAQPHNLGGSTNSTDPNLHASLNSLRAANMHFDGLVPTAEPMHLGHTMPQDSQPVYPQDPHHLYQGPQQPQQPHQQPFDRLDQPDGDQGVYGLFNELSQSFIWNNFMSYGTRTANTGPNTPATPLSPDSYLPDNLP